MREQTVAMYCFLDDILRLTRPVHSQPAAKSRHLSDAQVLTTEVRYIIDSFPVAVCHKMRLKHLGRVSHAANY